MSGCMRFGTKVPRMVMLWRSRANVHSNRLLATKAAKNPKAAKQQPEEDPEADEKKQQKKAIDAKMQAINKKFGVDTIRFASERPSPQEFLPTGVLTLDMILGGGWPKGRVVEIYGKESSGKTAVAMTAIREAQRNGKMGAIIDAEHAVSEELLVNMGVDLSQLVIVQPQCGEDAFGILRDLINTNSFAVIVVDSVSALVPKAEIEGDVGQAQMGAQARLMGQGLRINTAIAQQTKTTIIFINQLRDKIGIVYGSPEVTSGGHSLKYYSTARVDLRRYKKIDGIINTSLKGLEEKGTVGIKIKAKVTKLKSAAPFRECEFDFLFASGVDTAGCVLDAAEKIGLVERRGAWYYQDEERLGQGRDNVIEMFKSQEDKLRALEKLTRDTLKKGEDMRGEKIDSSVLSSTTGPSDFDDVKDFEKAEPSIPGVSIGYDDEEYALEGANGA